ncbi:MAG: adenosine deaminase, partial [Acidimicrobiales bacterium]|nr:adenosine deaminase [Acidimicrobiales bacterium]
MSSMNVLAAPDHPLRSLPKVELHCHVEGTARPATVAELAAKHGIPLGVQAPEDLYSYSSLSDFLAA